MKNIILFALFVVVVLAMQTSAIKWNLKRDVSRVNEKSRQKRYSPRPHRYSTGDDGTPFGVSASPSPSYSPSYGYSTGDDGTPFGVSASPSPRQKRHSRRGFYSFNDDA